MTGLQKADLKYLMDKVTKPQLWPEHRSVVLALVVNSMLNDAWDERLDYWMAFCHKFDHDFAESKT